VSDQLWFPGSQPERRRNAAALISSLAQSRMVDLGNRRLLLNRTQERLECLACS
jgi:hypothetical protein